MTVTQILSDYEVGLITRPEAVATIIRLLQPDTVDAVLQDLPADFIEALRLWTSRANSEEAVVLGGNLPEIEAQRVADHVRSVMPVVRSYLVSRQTATDLDGAATPAPRAARG